MAAYGSGLSALQQQQNAYTSAVMGMQQQPGLAGLSAGSVNWNPYTRTTGWATPGALTFREELQDETDKWLKETK